MDSNHLAATVSGIASILIGVFGLVYYLIAASHVAFEVSLRYWGFCVAFLVLVLVGLYLLGWVFHQDLREVESAGAEVDET